MSEINFTKELMETTKIIAQSWVFKLKLKPAISYQLGLDFYFFFVWWWDSTWCGLNLNCNCNKNNNNNNISTDFSYIPSQATVAENCISLCYWWWCIGWCVAKRDVPAWFGAFSWWCFFALYAVKSLKRLAINLNKRSN